MWSYDGWNQLNFVSQELEFPPCDLRWNSTSNRLLFTGQHFLFHRYDSQRAACFEVIQTKLYKMSYFKPSAVATTFGAKVFKDFAWIVPLGVACSTFGAANGSAFTAARLSYAAGANGHFPKFLSYLSHSRLTPLMAVVFNCALRWVFILMY